MCIASNDELRKKVIAKYGHLNANKKSLPDFPKKYLSQVHNVIPHPPPVEAILDQVLQRHFTWYVKNQKIYRFYNRVWFGFPLAVPEKKFITSIKNKNSDPNDTRLTLTYSFNHIYNCNQAKHGKKASLIEKYEQYFETRLAQSKYFNFQKIKDTNGEFKPAFRITLRKFLPGNNRGFVEDSTYFSNDSLQLVIETEIGSQEVAWTANHELGHILGLDHLEETFRQGQRGLHRFAAKIKTKFQNTTHDSTNLTNSSLRKIVNYNYRAITDAVFTILYGKKDPYPNGVILTFKPSNQDLTYTLPTEHSNEAVYEGICAGITYDNVNNGDYTDLNFVYIVPIPAHILQKHQKEFNRTSGLPLVNGVSAYIGPDANITFYSFLDTEYCLDKNVSSTFNVLNYRNIFGSNHNDFFEIDPLIKDVHITPGQGHDQVIFTSGEKNKLTIGKNEGQDTVYFALKSGGSIYFNYAQKSIVLHRENNDLYLTDSGFNGLRIKDYFLKAKNIRIYDAKKMLIKIDEHLTRVKPFGLSFFTTGYTYNPS